MATDTKTIKQKMRSVKNIGKITKAMEMISVSKMRKSVERRSASFLFAEHALALLETLHVHRELSHPYLEERSEGDQLLLVVIASNKGLCGGYNMNVSKAVTEYVKAHPGMKIDVIAVGKQAQKIAFRNKLNLVASFSDMKDHVEGSFVRKLCQTIFELFQDNDSYRSVHLAFTQFVSSLLFEAQTKLLIPLSPETTRDALNLPSKTLHPDYVFEPSEQEVLDVVVPSLLTTIVYQRLLESLASEHSARVSAMRSASDNAQEMLEDLTINYNRARQAGITQEIAEIVGGSSAMNQ